MTVVEQGIEYVVKPVATAALASVTFLEGVEVMAKLIATVAAVLVLIIQYLSYLSRKRVEDEQHAELLRKKKKEDAKDN